VCAFFSTSLISAISGSYISAAPANETGDAFVQIFNCSKNLVCTLLSTIVNPSADECFGVQLIWFNNLLYVPDCDQVWVYDFAANPVNGTLVGSFLSGYSPTTKLKKFGRYLLIGFKIA
jgi:hypothetical protein